MKADDAMDRFARFSEVDAALEAALDLPDDDRRAYLRTLAETDPWIASRVETLLRASAGSESSILAGGALSGSFGAALADRLRDEEETMPAVAGRYRLVSEIGRGGMSVVYLGLRENADFSQEVAVKILKRGIDTDDLVARFEQERQILASLNHPGIARLIDGGSTGDGRPFIAMEYVRGTPIDRYGIERGLSANERLRLFLDVAHAVQYAHRNLIVHRDLKPGNVLVTGDGAVKLLDFGIAKLLDDQRASHAPSTRPAVRIMTPEYASPEQRLGKPVTTASDVYQLGLMLYKLLAGRGAFEERPRADGAEPPAPSAAARPFPDGVVVDKELDCIVTMAIRPEPERRYVSVEQFAEDVERYLSSMPLVARAPTWSYRVRKFSRRHRMAVAAVTGVALATIGYAALATRQARALAAERDRARISAATAEQVSSFMVGVFTLANPTAGEGASVSARQLLDWGAVRLQSELADRPDVLAGMLRAVGNSYFGLGLNSQAEPLLRRSVALLRSHPAAGAALAASLNDLGRLELEQGRSAEAEQLLTEALTLRRRLHPTDHPDVAATLHELGRIRREAGDYGGAERLFRESLAIRERTLGRDDPAVAQSLHNLGLTFRAAGSVASAEPLLREALAIRQRRLARDAAETADSLNALGLLLRDRGDPAAAEPLIREALEANRRRLGPRHPYAATTMNNLALVLRDQGRFDLAEPLYREALDLLRAAYGPRHLRVAIALFNLAAVTEDQGRYADAEPLYREALEIDRQALGDAHAEVAADRMRLGMLLHLDGRSGEAEPLLRDSLARLRAALPPAHPRVADATFNLGTLLVDTKRAADAEPLLDEAVSIRRATYGADDPRTLLAIVTRDRAETALGHPPPLDALVDVRCRPLPGRYRVEVDRAVDRLLIELQRTVDSKAWRDIQSRASCSQKRPGTPAP